MGYTPKNRSAIPEENMRQKIRWAIACLLACSLVAALSFPAEAKAPAKAKTPAARKAAPKAKKSAPQKKAAPAPLPPISSICVEAETGMLLHEENADMQRPPASMVKLMIMLLVQEGLESGKWKLDQTIVVSQHAEKMGGSQVYVKMNDQWPLETLMKAIAVASANDASMAVAEGLWGSAEKCLEAMNARAKELGMNNTIYNSVHGLPPGPGQQADVTTARDMSVLGRECVKHPAIFNWTALKEFQLRPEEAPHPSTNKLMLSMPDCDGLKTGFIRLAGFCITATAKRNDVRVIAVVMGDDSKYERFRIAQQLMEEGLKAVKRVKVVAKGDPVGEPVPVENCMTPNVRLIADSDLSVVVKADDAPKVELVADRPAKLTPPVAAGIAVGEFRAQLAGNVLGKGGLINPLELKPKTLWQRLFGAATSEQPLASGVPAR